MPRDPEKLLTLDDLALGDEVPEADLVDDDDDKGWDRDQHGRMVDYAQRTPSVPTVQV